jgi:hypothetical protein
MESWLMDGIPNPQEEKKKEKRSNYWITLIYSGIQFEFTSNQFELLFPFQRCIN